MADFLTYVQTGVDVHCQRLYDWHTIDKSGGESLALVAQVAHEFYGGRRSI